MGSVSRDMKVGVDGFEVCVNWSVRVSEREVM